VIQRLAAILALSALGGVVAVPVQAQKNRPAPSGVPRPAAATPAPAPAPADTAARSPKPRRESPTLVRPGATVPASAAPAPAAPAAAPVTPQAAPTITGLSAGLSIEPFEGDEAAMPAYLRRFTQMLDSAAASLVNVFRNTSGQPMAGANEPTALSTRERDRWSRCRDLHWDLQSYVTAMRDLVEHDNVVVARAAAQLDSSLTALRATAECDNLASMIAAPERWSPWGSSYQGSARSFYGSWYPQIRDVADRNRAFVIALNTTLPPAERLPVPPALQRTPPYAGNR